MGCAPSKSAGIYSQEKVCRDLDTTSTYVPNLRSSLSTPEKPRLSVETSNDRQAFLTVPCREVHGRSVSHSLSSLFDRRGSAGTSVAPSSSCTKTRSTKTRSTKTRSVTPDLRAVTPGAAGLPE